MNRAGTEKNTGYGTERESAIAREISSPLCLYTYLLECRSGSPSHSKSLAEQDCCARVYVHTHHMNKASVSLVLCAFLCVTLVLMYHTCVSIYDMCHCFLC